MLNSKATPPPKYLKFPLIIPAVAMVYPKEVTDKTGMETRR